VKLTTRFNLVPIQECVELYLHFPNAPSWRGAQLKESTGTTLPLPLNIVYCLKFRPSQKI